MSATLTDEIAAAAARLVVEDGLEYGPAKRRAARALGRSAVRGADLPGNDRLEDEVREYLRLFCAETQPRELATLRDIAAQWMERLTAFRPHLAGAVWRGTATRLNDIHIELYCDDSKAAELALIDRRADYEVSSRAGPRGGAPVDVLSLAQRSDALGANIGVHLTILDHDDLRGALKPDGSGRSPRGDLSALRRLIASTAEAA